MLLSMNYSILVATFLPNQRPEINMATVSGISIPEDSAKVLLAQADFLATLEPSSTLFFSRHSYSLSMLTRRFNPLPVQDAFAETATNFDFDRLVTEINGISPRVILFDEPRDISVVAENRTMHYFNMHFFERLKIRLAEGYDQAQSKSGWQIWELRHAQGIPERKLMNRK
jgi:hypothetical protein